ncbi:MAG: FecR domain-containing protein [Pseudacidovorax sp.]|nr:FecR domain-containing protein [Pseudacidovorax sp.]
MNAPLRPSEDGPSLHDVVLDWFVRRQRESWSASDEAEFQAWQMEDARHRAAYARWEATWQALDAIPPAAVAVLRKRLAADKGREQAAVEKAHGRPAAGGPGRRRLGALPAFATAMALALTIGASLLGWDRWQAGPAFTQVYSTQRGQQLEAHLPDGSRVQLDAATRLEVRYGRRTREVRLSGGQAMFDVMPDPARPFDVLAGPLRVTVVGTLFSVRHTPDLPGGSGVRVAVERGRVRVAPASGLVVGEGGVAQEGVLLKAGQQVESDEHGLLATTTAVPGDGIAPWRANRVSFVNTPLGEALAELERYGSTGLVVRDPAVAALRLSGTFDPRDIRTLYRVLPIALPVRLRPFGGGTELVLAP